MAERDPWEDWFNQPEASPPVQTGSFGVTDNSTNPAGYQDLAYWQARHDQGLPGAPGVNDMFDENGQLREGFVRTANGYEYAPNNMAGVVPTTTPTIGGVPTTYGGDYRSNFGTGSPYKFSPLQWPDWSPPQFSAPPAFSYQDFKAPTLDEAVNEPGYKFAADEGAKRIQNNAAARGNVVSGAAIKDLVKWANDYATQNYNGVYGRGLQTYTTNRNNAADNYMTNYNVSRDVFDRSYNSYSAGDQSRRQKAQLDFQRDWDVYQSDLDTKKFLTTAGNQ